ncbi:MAG: hypothetical protein MPI95_02030 [Nitrosopumilus sp.]|nr:hypothetical protein [Nitrosopumilus sp.]MDA7944893.1 hypothetical protein [Nitrosopumilus sp.]MDA7953738.1 hypothetical protein [Nitrosopumilus sp.]MDA7954497.1 hypothetical protein [Nitrosopumilus sp.]MDA7957859.1 hypothetical protein [Nitrosopumilus sp.]
MEDKVDPGDRKTWNGWTERDTELVEESLRHGTEKIPMTADKMRKILAILNS